MERIMECVPNFSEGRDLKIIQSITDAISAVAGVELLDVDPGADTNRTVVTMVGSPEQVVEAAFQAIKTASRVIDMTKHKGAHARMGATDVCPFVPVRGLTMEECVAFAHQLGERVGRELSIPVYLYESAATTPERQNLADVRKGEYEGLANKLKDPAWQPDYGPAEFNAKSGATIIGVRKFLIAYNVNINSRSRRLAHNIALDIREKGRWLRDDKGKIVKKDGKKQRKPGKLKNCKAVGWYIDEYDRAQISINLTDYEVTPPHLAFDVCESLAPNYGVRVTGSELVGLIPLEAMLMAGRHYLTKQGLSTGIPEKQIVETAIQSLGLNELSHFDPKEKIIEYRLAGNASEKLVDMQCNAFADELSTDSPAPGGGSVAALCGALGAALAAMVANLTVGKKGFENVKPEMITVAEKAQQLKQELLDLVDRDTDAFNHLMTCFSMPKKTDEEKSARLAAIEQATQQATNIPLRVLELCVKIIDLAELTAQKGNPNSLSDAGVAVLSAQTGGEGAFLNVIINLQGITTQEFSDSVRSRALSLRKQLRQRGEAVLTEIYAKLDVTYN